MKVIKTRKQGILHKTFESGGKFYLSAAAFHFFDFNRKGLLSEQAMWPLTAEELGKETVFDDCMPKSSGEALVAGKYFSPGGIPVTAGHIEFRLGPINKTLYVFGERRWQGAPGMRVIRHSDSFSEMDIKWENAFGGPDYAKNPLGKGHQPVIAPTGEAIHFLPNIENPARLISSTDDAPEPAGLTPLDISWPQRNSLAGTYDDKWLAERFPGYADDMDWTIFNASPPDQRIKGYFNGDEHFSFINMHKDKLNVHGRLPGFRPRIFLNRETPKGRGLSEITMRMDTVWFFPHLEKGIVVHHGFTEILTDDAEDVLHLMAGYEEIESEPLPFEYYRLEFVKRSDEQTAHMHFLRDSGLAPQSEVENQQSEDEEEGKVYKSEQLLAANLEKKAELEREKLKTSIEKFGLNPDDVLPPPPPKPPSFNPDNIDLEEIDKMVEKTMAMAAEQQEKGMAGMKEMCARFGVDLDQTLEEIKGKAGGKPKFSADEIIKKIQKYSEVDPETEKKLRMAEAQADEAYKQFAQHFPAPPPLSDAEAARLKENFVSDLSSRRDFSGRDFTAWDFSGLDLKNVSFKDCILDAANFKDADLTRADLTGATAARVNFNGARLQHALLVNANLGKANFTGADLSSADLTNSILFEADLTETDLSEAVLKNTDLMNAVFRKTIFTRAVLPGTLFLEAELVGCDFSSADISKSIFISPKIAGVDFTGIKAEGVIMVQAEGRGCKFAKADMTNARLVRQGDFATADFSEALLDGANLMEADLTGANFVGAKLNGANLMFAVLKDARMSGVVARQANFIKADLSRAKMTGADLMEANLMKARLAGTDLNLSNLYGAEFFRSVLGETKFAGANLKMTKLAGMSEQWNQRI